MVDEETLISVKFGDQARGDKPTPGTPASKSDGAAGETKSAIDRQTGQVATLRPDSMAGTGKPTGSTGVVTGATVPAVGGTVKPEGSFSNGASVAQGTDNTVKAPEFRKTERTEGNKKITEEITIEKKEELPEKITTTTTTKTTEIVITNSSGTKTTKTTVETKVATPTGTTITTKVTGVVA